MGEDLQEREINPPYLWYHYQYPSYTKETSQSSFTIIIHGNEIVALSRFVLYKLINFQAARQAYSAITNKDNYQKHLVL